MIKKLFILMFSFFLLLTNLVFAELPDKDYYTKDYDNTWYWTTEDVKKYQEYLNSEAQRLWIQDSTKIDWKVWWDTKALQEAISKAQEQKSNIWDNNSCSWEDELCSNSFQINVWDITPWWEKLKLKWNNVKEKINFLLWTIIQKLMIALGTLALLIMTIWAWYMIFYHWQDELLSKWKSIFMSWVIALIVALSSYYIISFIRFILYSS